MSPKLRRRRVMSVSVGLRHSCPDHHRPAGETQRAFNLDSLVLGALVAAEQPIFGYNAWGLALFLSDLHLLPTGLLLSWVAAVPLILPGCPRSQRQVVAWAGDCALQFIRRMTGRPLCTIVAVVVFEIFIPSLGTGTYIPGQYHVCRGYTIY